MEPNPDRPITEWSEDQLLDEYRSPSGQVGHGGVERPAIIEEILRRGLPLPEAPDVPQTENVDWSGEPGGEDPGSGALPRPF